MKARMITRCGCERIINVPVPPPLEFVLPLAPRVPNEGLVRPWLNSDPAQYDPRRDGLAVRKFKLSLESLNCADRWMATDDRMVWYDEITDYDPPAFNVDKRTYAPTTEIK